MSPSVKKVLASNNFTLKIYFNNGEFGVLGMKPYLNFGVFKKLQDPYVFKAVKVSFDTIEWPSGADLSPEFVYEKSKKARIADTKLTNEKN